MVEYYTIYSVFVLNRVAINGSSKRMGDSSIWIGDDSTPFSTSLIQAKSGMYDTGFYELDTLTTGRYLVIRRNGPSSASWGLDF